jgi:hypothetical protein
LGPPGRQREELVAGVDERHPPGAAAQLEAEQPPVELERGLYVADLERDVVEADQARGHRLHRTSTVAA